MAAFPCHLLQIGLKILQAETSENDQSLGGRVIKEHEIKARSKPAQIAFLLSNTLTPTLVFLQKSRSLKTDPQLSSSQC